MKAKPNKALLVEFRKAGSCEWCGRPRFRREPHHLFTRGLGGGTRLDHRWNLASLCRDCHQSHHDGHQPTTGQLIELVAKREGLPPTALQAWLWQAWRKVAKYESLSGCSRSRPAHLARAGAVSADQRQAVSFGKGRAELAISVGEWCDL